MKPDYRKAVIKFIPGEHSSFELTMDWFAQKALYPPRFGVKVTPLINGEQAFGAVYDAIEAATRSAGASTRRCASNPAVTALANCWMFAVATGSIPAC